MYLPRGGRSARESRRSSNKLVTVGAVAASASVLVLGGCGAPSCDSGTGPDVCSIEPAITAVQKQAGGDVQFYEIDAYAESVHLVVKADKGATSFDFVDGELKPAEDYPDADGAAFSGEAVDFDPEAIFDQVRSDLGDPAITDFAVTGGPGGSVVYDSKILGSKGGALLVRLTADGDVVGVQAD